MGAVGWQAPPKPALNLAFSLHPPGTTRRPCGLWPSTPGTHSLHLALMTAASLCATGWCTSECPPHLPHRDSGVVGPCAHVLSPCLPHSDLLQNPLLVPVKVLKGHVLTRGLGVLDVAFHPTQPWVFSSGADGTIRLFT